MPLFQNETKSKTIVLKMTFSCMKFRKTQQSIKSKAPVSSSWMNVSLCLCFKTSLRVKMSSVGGNHMNGFAYLDSFRHRDKMQLGNGLLDECRKRSWVKRRVKYSKIKILVKCDAEVLMSKYGWLLTPFTCRWLNSFSGKINL